MRTLEISDFQLLEDSETANVKGLPTFVMKRETYRNDKGETRLNIYTLIRLKDNEEMAMWSDNASVFEPEVVTIDMNSNALEWIELKLLHAGYSLREGNL